MNAAAVAAPRSTAPPVLLAGEGLLAREFRRAFLDRLGRHPEPHLGSRALALVTWEDLLRDGPERTALLVAARVAARQASGAPPARVTVCLVPYGSFAGEEGRTDEYLFGPPHASGGGRSSVAGEAVRLLTSAVPDAQLAFAPMVVGCACGESGYTSAVQRLVRVARALADEARSKVPTYFDAYELTVTGAAGGVLNAATPADVVEGLFDQWREEAAAGRRDAVVRLEHLVPWPALLGWVRASGLPLARADAAARTTALDEVLNEIVFSAGPPRREPYRLPGDGPSRCLSSPELPEVLRRLCSAPLEAWETSYDGASRPDLEAVPALRRTVRGPRAYYAGGAGPVVLLVPPPGLDPGYYAALAAEIVREHRVLLWQPRSGPPDVPAESAADAYCADVREMLRGEHVDACHVVAWCGGVRIVARLVEACGGMLRTISLFAPVLCGAEAQTDGYRSSVRFVTEILNRPGDAGHLVARARAALEAGPARALDQYAPEGAKRSPLQYHPDWFWPRLIEELFGDARRVVALASESLANMKDAPYVLGQLRAFAGPVLVIAGTHDGLIHYQGVERACLDLRRATLATVLGGNHYLLLEHGRAVGAMAVEFFRHGALRPGHDRVDGCRIRVEAGRRRGAQERT